MKRYVKLSREEGIITKGEKTKALKELKINNKINSKINFKDECTAERCRKLRYCLFFGKPEYI